MKQVFLHIGLHKTGSTTLQVFLHKNRKKLAAHGYFYPQIGIPKRMYGQHNLAWLLNQTARANPQLGDWQQLHQTIERRSLDQIIISSESFETKRLNVIEKIANNLQGCQVRIIVYLRRQDRRIESQYTQLIKSGLYVGDINAFTKLFLKKYDYFKFLEPWQQVFGKDNIIVRPLEKPQISDICSDFCKIIGINSIEEFETINARNQKPGLKTLAVTKYLTALYHGIEINYPSVLSDNRTLQNQYLCPIINYTAKNWQESRKYRLLPYQKSVEILERFEESNAKVAAEYLNRANQTLFYEPLTPYEISSFNLENLNLQEVLSLCLALNRE
jgi:hypothetical protein